MLCFGELASSYPAQTVDQTFTDVFLSYVTIVIYKKLRDQASVLAHFVENAEYKLFMVERRVSTL